jgi:predicted permease
VGVVLGSGLLAWPLARWMKVEARTFLPPMMFNNSGNIGLPLAVLAFGEGMLPAAVALFATSNLLHFTLGTSIVRGDAHFAGFLRSPMVLATAGGVALSLSGLGLPGFVGVAVRMAGDVAVPLMIFTLGVRMATTPLGVWRVGLAGGVVRPLAGLAMALPLGALLGLSGSRLGLLYLFASLPPAILNFMVAERYRQEPDKVASIVLIGHLASLVFVPLGLALALRTG